MPIIVEWGWSTGFWLGFPYSMSEGKTTRKPVLPFLLWLQFPQWFGPEDLQRSVYCYWSMFVVVAMQKIQLKLKQQIFFYGCCFADNFFPKEVTNIKTREKANWRTYLLEFFQLKCMKAKKKRKEHFNNISLLSHVKKIKTMAWKWVEGNFLTQIFYEFNMSSLKIKQEAQQ